MFVSNIILEYLILATGSPQQRGPTFCQLLCQMSWFEQLIPVVYVNWINFIWNLLDVEDVCYLYIYFCSLLDVEDGCISLVFLYTI